MKRLFKFIKFSFILSVIILMFILYSDRIVEINGSNKVYNSTKEIPNNNIGLLLGTGKVLGNGQINLFYKYRIDAAVRLFKSGKINFILVSGDNGSKEYDEPSTIKNDLIARGIPASKIYLDYAGFRTLDSVIRCREIFGQKSITVISQQFHNERALFIARNKGIDAVGYNAKSVGGSNGTKVLIREKFARVKMILDLTSGKKPKYLGERIIIK